MRFTTWLRLARHGAEGRGALHGQGGGSFGPLDRPPDQKAAPAQLSLKLGGEAIGDPGTAQLPEECDAAQPDGEAHEQLQGQFEHAVASRC